jgi:hypothetical protein
VLVAAVELYLVLAMAYLEQVVLAEAELVNTTQEEAKAEMDQ